MDDIIKRELDKFRSEIVKSLLQTHHLQTVRGRALVQVLSSVIVEFNAIADRLEGIKLEPLRRRLRNEYNELSRGAEARRLPATSSEYVGENLPGLINAELMKILGSENTAETNRKKARSTAFQ